MNKKEIKISAKGFVQKHKPNITASQAYNLESMLSDFAISEISKLQSKESPKPKQATNLSAGTIEIKSYKQLSEGQRFNIVQLHSADSYEDDQIKDVTFEFRGRKVVNPKGQKMTLLFPFKICSIVS